MPMTDWNQPIDFAQLYRDTMRSEMDLEVDFDLAALEILATCNTRLRQATVCRAKSIEGNAISFHEETERRLQEAKGRLGESISIPSPATLEVDRSEFSAIVRKLVLHFGNIKEACIGSRLLRCEAICLFIMGCVHEHKEDFSRGLGVLHRTITNPNCEQESKYRSNIAVRYDNLLGLYRLCFSEEPTFSLTDVGDIGSKIDLEEELQTSLRMSFDQQDRINDLTEQLANRLDNFREHVVRNGSLR